MKRVYFKLVPLGEAKVFKGSFLRPTSDEQSRDDLLKLLVTKNNFTYIKRNFKTFYDKKLLDIIIQEREIYSIDITDDELNDLIDSPHFKKLYEEYI